MTRRTLATNDLVRTFLGDSGGAALVETTLMMPFLLVLCAGVIEFGSIFYNKMLIETGVRDAARYMARCSTGSCSESSAKNIAVYGNAAGAGDPRVEGWAVADVDIANVSFSNDDGSGVKLYRGGATILIVRVSTTYTYEGTRLLDFLGFDGIEFASQHEERVIGW